VVVWPLESPLSRQPAQAHADDPAQTELNWQRLELELELELELDKDFLCG
jgi:hypothetical protein